MRSNVVHYFLDGCYFTPGPEWDSSDEDDNIVNEITKNALTTKKTLKQKRKGSLQEKKGGLNSKSSSSSEASSVIYIGHIPSGMEENELLTFLSQFGTVSNIKLSRSKRTGNSRGYCFVDFADVDVAAVVAETMSGYLLMGEKRLVCHIVPKDKIHPDLFRGVSLKSVLARQRRTNGNESLVKYWQDQNKKEVNQVRTVQGLKKITQRLIKREMKKRSKLASLGIDYVFPGYAASGASGLSNGSDLERVDGNPQETQSNAKVLDHDEHKSSSTTLFEREESGVPLQTEGKKKRKASDNAAVTIESTPVKADKKVKKTVAQSEVKPKKERKLSSKRRESVS